MNMQGKCIKMKPILLLAWLVLTACGSPSLASAPISDDFIRSSGGLLWLRGSVLCASYTAHCDFVGLGINYASSQARAAGKCFGTPSPSLDAELKQMNPAMAVTRTPFFQYIDSTGGQRDWRPTDVTLAMARANDVRIVAELGDQWGNCEQTGTAAYKNLAWYQSGYKTTILPGTTTTYRQWAIEVATRYRNDPYIGVWQLLNEAEAASALGGSCDEATAASTMKAFVDDVGGAIHTADPNHLVDLGTIGSGQCGTSGTDYQLVHGSAGTDLCEYHDYSAYNVTMPGDQYNGLATRISQCGGLGKPLFIGESGIRSSDVGGNLTLRANSFVTKRQAQTNAGAQGFLIYTWCAIPNCDVYGVSPGDPVLAVL